ncbi:MAG: metallophosphoesterase, partial [Synechococcaceae cyanobacterium]|nr:metallophosphoesterase [Synechococcaceae cyanobacterium]
DGDVPWLVCGGSGYSLRRQRRRGPVLREGGDPVADSLAFHGRSGHGRTLRRPYSAVRIDVAAGEPLRLRATGLLAMKAEGRWHEECVPLPLAAG